MPFQVNRCDVAGDGLSLARVDKPVVGGSTRGCQNLVERDVAPDFRL